MATILLWFHGMPSLSKPCKSHTSCGSVLNGNPGVSHLSGVTSTPAPHLKISSFWTLCPLIPDCSRFKPISGEKQKLVFHNLVPVEIITYKIRRFLIQKALHLWYCSFCKQHRKSFSLVLVISLYCNFEGWGSVLDIGSDEVSGKDAVIPSSSVIHWCKISSCFFLFVVLS